MKELMPSCCLLAEGNGAGKKALMDGASTLVSVLSPDCSFRSSFCFLPWCCCHCVSMLYSALLTGIYEMSQNFKGCLFTGAVCATFSVLLGAFQGICLIAVCSSKTVCHFKPPHKILSFLPSWTSTLTQRPFQWHPTGVIVIFRLCSHQCQKFLETKKSLQVSKMGWSQIAHPQVLYKPTHARADRAALREVFHVTESRAWL